MNRRLSVPSETNAISSGGRESGELLLSSNRVHVDPGDVVRNVDHWRLGFLDLSDPVLLGSVVLEVLLSDRLGHLVDDGTNPRREVTRCDGESSHDDETGFSTAEESFELVDGSGLAVGVLLGFESGVSILEERVDLDRFSDSSFLVEVDAHDGILRSISHSVRDGKNGGRVSLVVGARLEGRLVGGLRRKEEKSQLRASTRR